MRLRFSPALIGGAALLLLVVLLLARLLLFVTHSLDVLLFPWQIDFDEGIILHSSWLLAQGQNPYPANGPDYFASSVYPPLFYAINALALKIWGLNLWSGRGLSLLGTLLAAGALVAWTVGETRSRAAGLLAGAFWLALGPVIVWASFYKMDVLALGFEAAGGALLVAGSPPLGSGTPPAARRWAELSWPVWAALVPMLLAFWTKQSALAPLAAAGVYLLWRDWRSALRWGAVAALALVGPFLLLDLLTHGQLYDHLNVGSDYALSAGRLQQNMSALTTEHWPLLLVSAATAVFLLLITLRSRTPLPLSVLYALFSAPVLLLTNLSPHANYNHLLDGLLPLCLFVGVGAGHLLNAVRTRPLAWLPLAAVVGLLAAQTALFTPLSRWYSPLGQPLDDKGRGMAQVQREVRTFPGDLILAEDDWMALRAGKTLPFDDTSQMATQAENGRWDQSLFLALLQQRQFPLIVLEEDLTSQVYSPRWTPDALAALQANYTIKDRNVRYVYVPDGIPPAPPVALDCALDGGPRLTGIYLPGAAAYLPQGAVQAFSLYWTAPPAGSGGPVRPGLKFSVHLIDARGALAWQADVPPGAPAGQPWPAWAAGAAVRDDLQVQVPATAALGSYTLTLSAYDQQGTQITAVPFACANPATGPTLTLAKPTVIAPLHQ